MPETVMVSDLHGQAERFKTVVNYYPDDTHYVINGDVFDRGPDTKGLIDIIKDLNYDLILGNHEWAYLGALSDNNPMTRQIWQQMVLSDTRRQRYEMNVLRSYGVPEYKQTEDTCKALLERLQLLGHWAVLRAASMYFEDTTSFVVHAGLRSELDMRASYQRLDTFAALHQGKNYSEEPDEISSFAFASDHARPRDLKKTLVTGHAHFKKSARDRVYYGRMVRPQRVFLGSFIDMGAPLYAYESGSQQIREF